MQAWLDGLAPGFGTALMWTIVALIGLLVLLILVRIFRGLTFGTFVAGGRNRKTRLAVMDATAVDSHRRLVLVRRDDIEHLILIGGPTDVVVEQNIRLVPAPRRPAADEPAAAPTRPAQQPAPATPQPPRQPVRPAESRSFAAAPRPVATPPAPPVSAPPVVQRPVEPTPAPTTQSSPEQRPVAAPYTASAHAVPANRATTPPPRGDSGDEVQDAMLEELDVMLEKDDAAEPVEAPAVDTGTRGSLDEEMSRLLNDLSGPKR